MHPLKPECPRKGLERWNCKWDDFQWSLAMRCQRSHLPSSLRSVRPATTAPRCKSSSWTQKNWGSQAIKLIHRLGDMICYNLPCWYWSKTYVYISSLKKGWKIDKFASSSSITALWNEWRISYLVKGMHWYMFLRFAVAWFFRTVQTISAKMPTTGAKMFQTCGHFAGPKFQSCV